MAKFEAKVYRLEIEEHPNADTIELAKVGDYRSIVRKGQFKTGDLGVYIPEAAIVPDWLISMLGLEGKLAGKAKNRVKAIKLRGILSQGLIVPIEYRENVMDQDTHVWSDRHVLAHKFGGAGISVEEGQDVTEYLGITKWEPVIPSCMNGEVFNAFGYTLKYDIENLKKFPNVLVEGEEVVMTEKLHGTWCCFGFHPEIDHPIVTSKGLSEKGLIFKMNDANERNLYVRALMNTVNENGNDIITRIRNIHLELLNEEPAPFYILGEIFGYGVQDLTYGLNDVQFRVFDIYQGEPEQGRYKDYHSLRKFCANHGLEMVPELYVGPFSKEVLMAHTDGTTVIGSSVHMREGIVITPTTERYDVEIGRVILKSVSEKYILRKNATEYN
jgi:RNA ligase (TIGR02306 family)